MKSSNILISSAGRRVELLQCFRSALRDYRLDGAVYCADCSLTSPACYHADRFWQVSKCCEPSFITEMLELSLQEEIGLIVPTIDLELLTLATNRKRFAQYGISLCVSSPETVQICCDKVATHEWFKRNNIPTVRQAEPAEVLASPEAWSLPLIAKPRNGSASKGVRRINSLEELRWYMESTPDLIVQEIAQGHEYTINVYVNSAGRCVCAVPHRRLEVRAGEVSKAVTVKHHQMMQVGKMIAERLPGAWGPLNIQCFLADDGAIRVIEINARFGGGYPLAHAAGARFTNWIVNEVLTGVPAEDCSTWTDDLAMLRYDQAVIQPASHLQVPTLAAASVNGARFG